MSGEVKAKLALLDAPGTTCGGCGAQWPDLHVYHPGPGGTLCVKCGWTPDDAANPYRAASTPPVGYAQPLPLHRTEANYGGVVCGTCDGGGCLDCTDPA